MYKLPARMAAGLIGPILVLLVTWLPPISVTRVDQGAPPEGAQIERMRTVPSDAVLSDMRSFAVAADRFDGLRADEIKRAAAEVMAGRFEWGGEVHPVNVPFDANGDVLGTSSWHLQICSLVVPNLLAQAYSVTRDPTLLQAAVTYTLDWSRFERTLLLPAGLVFNDHATAARAIVVTEVWHQYRSSPIFERATGARLLAYAQRLASLLRKPELYEYRSNHGVMQSLALLHLAIAFPLLEKADLNARVGAERFFAQMPYFINEEGVVLEHSPAYHHNGLNRLAAGLRYLAFLGVPVPDDLADRYRRGVRFDAVLRRPDGTLPPIGDTYDDAVDDLNAATTAQGSVVQAPADPVTVAAAAGYAVFLQYVDRPPDAAALTQTVEHWGNFPTKAHKHADDLGLSLWAGGTQWVRAVGYWPYEISRPAATGWRSSNAPHWLDEPAEIERSNMLLGTVATDQLKYLDVSRVNSDGSTVRRQLVQPGPRTWLVIDSLQSVMARKAEIVWRFPPGIKLSRTTPDGFVLESVASPMTLAIHFDANGTWNSEADETGAAEWNSGVVHAGRVTRSPAIRLAAAAANPVLLTVFELRNVGDPDRDAVAADLEWQNPERWQVLMTSGDLTNMSLKRSGARLSIAEPNEAPTAWTISDKSGHTGAAADRAARAAFMKASQRYGQPFNSMLESRTKVTAAIGACTLVQIALFVMTRRWTRWRLLLATSMSCWIAWAAFLHLGFLR